MKDKLLVSKTTLIYALNIFRQKKYYLEIKIGKITFYKFKH